ncbi:hypothetical protein VTP01DRAFT_9733 [Rhizomucor pusillus]|uniref:uncharacterized protein n=1 Tax=Rhizomucor pusillus TaxID=4840 RepID=UPI0037440323
MTIPAFSSISKKEASRPTECFISYEDHYEVHNNKQIQPVLVRGWAVHSFWAYCLRVQMFLGDNTDEHTTADVQNSSSSTTQRADKPKRRTMTVKSSISGVAWRDEYRAPFAPGGNREALSANQVDGIGLEFYDLLFSAYPDGYEFEKDSIYYDSKSRSEIHLLAYIKVAEFCESRKIKTFQTLPLRTSWIPAHMQIDTNILSTQILSNPHQDINKLITFRGTINTDGFDVSIVKQNFKPGPSGRRRRLKIDDVDIPYIHQLEKETVQEIQPRAVYIDPGRRDLLYCMHNSSSLTERNVFRYTRNMKAQDTKSTQYRKLRQNTKLAEIRECERKLAATSATSVDNNDYIKYIKAQRSLLQYRADDALVKKIKTHFGPNPVLKNLEVYRIDEFKTSSFCATCGAALENFKKVPDPRPYQRKKMPVVICHGLLRCANKKYLQLWNRDQVVVLNFRVYAALLLLMRNTEGSTTVDADKEKDVTICPMVIYPCPDECLDKCVYPDVACPKAHPPSCPPADTNVSRPQEQQQQQDCSHHPCILILPVCPPECPDGCLVNATDPCCPSVGITYCP